MHTEKKNVFFTKDDDFYVYNFKWEEYEDETRTMREVEWAQPGLTLCPPVLTYIPLTTSQSSGSIKSQRHQ